MNDGPPHLTLRQLRADLTAKPALVVMGAVGVLLGLSGPFGTIDVLHWAPRILYWLVIVVVTYCGGAVIAFLCEAALTGRAVWLRVAISALAIGVAVFAFLLGFNYAVFGTRPDSWAEAAQFLGLVIVIAAVIQTSAFLLRDFGLHKDPPPTATKQRNTAAILSRLPLDKRGTLISMSVTDHYVEIRTSAGAELVLMRLSDAIRETEPVAGLQVHRSHWVALDQVAKVTREGDRAILTLKDGHQIPASRSNLPALRTAGLLV